MLHALIADAKVMRLFEVRRSGLAEFAVFHNPESAAHERDLVADRPGRVVNPAARSRQTYAPRTDARAAALQRWVRFIGAQLPPLLEIRCSEGLLIAASPRLLAQLRAALPARARALMLAEAPRGLTKLPHEKLEARILPVIDKAMRERRRAVLMRASGRGGAAGSRVH